MLRLARNLLPVTTLVAAMMGCESPPAAPNTPPIVTVNVPPGMTTVTTSVGATPTPAITINLPPATTPNGSTKASICVGVSASDNTTIVRRVTLDGTPLRTKCRNVDPHQVHTVMFDDIEGYITPQMITITADEAEAGDTVTIDEIYTKDATTRCITTTDQFGNKIPATIILEGEVVGTGTFCGEVASTDTIEFDNLAGFNPPSPQTVYGRDLSSRTTRVRYEAVNAAQLCLEPTNENGDAINVNAIIDGFQTENNCKAINISQPHRAVFPWVSDLSSPTTYLIAPGALGLGTTKRVQRIFLASTRQTKTHCLEMFAADRPYEVFVQNAAGEMRSLGWQLGRDEIACERFGANENPALVMDARVVFYQASETEYGGRYYVGIPRASSLALVTVTTSNPWGQETDLNLTVTGTVHKHTYGRPVTTTIDPRIVNTIEFEEDLNLNTPSTISIAATTIAPASYHSYNGEYTLINVGDDYKNGIVQVYGPTIQGTAYQLQAQININQGVGNYQIQGPEYYISWNRQSPQTYSLTFGQVAGLAAPGNLRIDTMDPAASGAIFSMSENRYVWRVEYRVADPVNAPVALVCASARDHNGTASGDTYLYQFDTFRPEVALNRMSGCKYETTNQFHVVSTTNWYSAFRSPNYASIPAGKLNPGELHSLVFTYVPEAVAGNVCVMTQGAQGEIFVNSASVGWNATLGSQTCVTVDRTRLVRIEYGSVVGFRTPAAVEIAVGQITQNGGPAITSVYSPL